MDGLTHLTDQDLLRHPDRPVDAFAAFYRRHLPVVLGFVLRRVGQADVAADVTAEVFAAALERRAAFDAARGTAPAWLCTIAAHKIADSCRRGRVEDACRRRLRMAPLALDDQDLRRVEEIAAARALVEDVEGTLSTLPADMREAVRWRVVEERDYGEIARRLRVSESVVRKRVSRGLGHLRTQVQDTR